jgi:antirestriction protein ArdC
MARRDIHQEVTDSIVAALEEGVAPWVKPWNAEHGMPCNASTGRQYNGVNVFLLWLTAGARGYASNRWLTYKQATKLGGSVKKGQNKANGCGATNIVFFNWREFKDKKDPSKITRIPFLRFYQVFNVEQCQDLPEKAMGVVDEADLLSDEDRIAGAEEFFATLHTGMGITPKRGGAKACYSPALDEIHLPEFESFKDAESAYSTEAHEFGHATGHESRLDRELSTHFGGSSYAAEELVAELTSAFVCSQLEIQGGLQHPEYIGHWIKVLKGNTMAIFTASSLAKKAHAFIAERGGKPLESPTKG